VAPVPAEAERRQLTVLFCDLVDSTQLAAGMDPEDWREVVRGYQQRAAEVVERFDGHVAQYLGDGLLVYFGWPSAHEDDAERAVRAGLGIVDTIAAGDTRLAVRIGIHTGPVVVGEMGGGASRETLAMGDTTNVAARLQVEAEPDSVVLSAATLRLVPGAFLTEALGELALKGIGSPVTAHRALRASGVRSRLDVAVAGALTPLVGREQEVALLLDRWQEAKEGNGQVVLLSGEAGMGKTRLVQVLHDRVVEEEPHSWVKARGSAYHQNSAFHPVIELLGRALLFTPEDAPEEQIDRLERGLEEAGVAVRETLPLFASLLSLPLPSHIPPLNLSSDARRRHTLESMCAWLLALAEQQPLILVAEDLHWYDASTLELLGMLLEQAPTAPVFLLFTYRPTFEPPWPSHSHVTQLPLHPLTRRQMETLVTNVAGGRRLPAEVVEQIVAKTDRIPLFVEELTKTVLESDLLVEEEGRFELRGPLPELAIPSTLQDSLMARLDRLGPAKEVAQLCAALGRDFSHELLEAVSPMEPDLLGQVLTGLASAELLYQRGLPPRSVYHFKHALLQEMAYQSLLKKTRREYHARIAKALEERFPERIEAEPEVVAHHYEEAGLSEKAIDAYQRAGERATERSAHAEATSHLEKAIDLLLSLPESRERDTQELELRILLTAPLISAKGLGHAEVERAYERARELSQAIGGAPHLSLALYGLSTFYQTRGRIALARETDDLLLSLAERAGDPALLLWAHLAWGITLYFQGVPADSLRHCEASIAYFDRDRHRRLASAYGQDPDVLSRVYASMSLWQVGRPEAAVTQNEEALALAREHGLPFSLGFALAFGCSLHQMRRGVARAADLAEECFAYASEQELPLYVGISGVVGAWTRAQRIGGAEGLEELRDSLTALASTGAEVGGPYFLSMLADAAIEQDRYDDAVGAIELGLAISAAKDNGFFDAELHRLKGEALLRRDPTRSDEAERAFQRSIDASRTQGARSLELRAATSLARLWQRQDKRAEARNLLQPVYDWFTEGFDTQDLKDAKALLEDLA
jgi:class 3 adenylate cyclase/predicted ATPase